MQGKTCNVELKTNIFTNPLWRTKETFQYGNEQNYSRTRSKTLLKSFTKHSLILTWCCSTNENALNENRMAKVCRVQPQISVNTFTSLSLFYVYRVAATIKYHNIRKVLASAAFIYMSQATYTVSSKKLPP